MKTWITNLRNYFNVWQRLHHTQNKVLQLQAELHIVEAKADSEAQRARHFESAYRNSPIGEADKLLRLAQELIAPPPDARPVNSYELRCWLDDYRQYLLKREQLKRDTPMAPGTYYPGTYPGWRHE